LNVLCRIFTDVGPLESVRAPVITGEAHAQ